MGIGRYNYPKSTSPKHLVCHYGFYKFKFITNSLYNAPATLQRAMYITLNILNWKSSLVYLDAVIVLRNYVRSDLDGPFPGSTGNNATGPQILAYELPMGTKGSLLGGTIGINPGDNIKHTVGDPPATDQSVMCK